jgi:hypothetical protein
LGFTEEENRRMDEIMREERQATADGLWYKLNYSTCTPL